MNNSICNMSFGKNKTDEQIQHQLDDMAKAKRYGISYVDGMDVDSEIQRCKDKLIDGCKQKIKERNSKLQEEKQKQLAKQIVIDQLYTSN